MTQKYSANGIPIFDLDRRVQPFRHCLDLPDPREDAMGHLMDLVLHLAPGWSFCGLDGIAAVQAHYGQHPTPIRETGRRPPS
jgi:hypothetical protein